MMIGKMSDSKPQENLKLEGHETDFTFAEIENDNRVCFKLW